jgi:hypothetical protein
MVTIRSPDRAASLLKPAHLSPADCEASHPLSQSRSSIRYETVTSFWIRRSHKFLCFFVDSYPRCPSFWQSPFLTHVCESAFLARLARFTVSSKIRRDRDREAGSLFMIASPHGEGD